MSKKSRIILIAASLLLNFAQAYAQQVAVPVLSYTFNQPSDDSGTYSIAMEGTAAIVEMTDDNKALFTGPSLGYADLGAASGKAIMARLTGNYSIHIDLCVRADNSLSRFCWAFAFANGTGQYVGLVTFDLAL